MTANSIVNMELELSLLQQNQFNLCTCKVRTSDYSMLFRFHLSHARSSKKGAASSSQTITLAGNFSSHSIPNLFRYAYLFRAGKYDSCEHAQRSMPIRHFESKISLNVQYNIAVGIHIFPQWILQASEAWASFEVTSRRRTSTVVDQEEGAIRNKYIERLALHAGFMTMASQRPAFDGN